MSITPDERPRRPDETIVRLKRSDGSLTVRTPAGEVVELNSTAAALWALCDGQTSVQEIVGAATTFFAGSPESIEADILATLATLEDQGLLGRSDR